MYGPVPFGWVQEVAVRRPCWLDQVFGVVDAVAPRTPPWGMNVGSDSCRSVKTTVLLVDCLDLT